MDLSSLRAVAAAIGDPVMRAKVLSQVLGEQQEVVTEAARLRRAAIAEARANGITQDEIARALGVTPGRVSQMGKVRASAITGWFSPTTTSAAQPRLAICGSRSGDAELHVLDEVLRPLGALLARRRCQVTHGPVGVGIEVMTYIADHYRPPGMGEITGVFGRPNIVRDVDYVLVVGGGQGTQDEVDLAFSMAKKVIPMSISGGTARRAYASMRDTSRLRAWIAEPSFEALASAGAEQYAQIVDQLLTEGSEEEAGS